MILKRLNLKSLLVIGNPFLLISFLWSLVAWDSNINHTIMTSVFLVNYDPANDCHLVRIHSKSLLVFFQGIRTSMDNATTAEMANCLVPLSDLARKTVKDLDPGNELLFFRMRTSKNEMMMGVGRKILIYFVKQFVKHVRNVVFTSWNMIVFIN